MSTAYRLFITGSSCATPAMAQAAYRAVQRARQHGWTILVGDRQGVDAAVVRACDLLGVEVTIVGIARKPRSVVSRYPNRRYICYQDAGTRQRDRYLAGMADRGLFIWNGSSPGAKALHDYMSTLDKPVHLMIFV
jgi:hypothetical protein